MRIRSRRTMPIAVDALGEVLVDASRSRPARHAGRRQPGPSTVAQSRHRPRPRPSAQQVMPSARSARSASRNWARRSPVQAGARLVAGEHVVAPGLDDVVGRRADVGDVRLAEEGQHRVDEAMDRVHRPPVRRPPRRARVVGAEQLERGVDEVNMDRRDPTSRRPVRRACGLRRRAARGTRRRRRAGRRTSRRWWRTPRRPRRSRA